MRYEVVGVAIRSLVILLLASTTVRAQSVSTAQINGTVKDAGGLALPGVTMTVTQTDTSLTRSAVTNDTGSYTLTNLPVGPYRLEAALQGFRTYVQTSPNFGLIALASDPRIMQLALKYTF